MLTQTLRSLERDGLVTRTVTAEVPSASTTSSLSWTHAGAGDARGKGLGRVPHRGGRGGARAIRQAVSGTAGNG
jgi:hypothetical protein